MVIGQILLLVYLSLPVGVLIWSYRRPRPDAGERARSTKTAWAWVALLVVPIFYVGAAVLVLVGAQDIGYRIGSSPPVETAIAVSVALVLLVPTVTGVVLGAIGWCESHRLSPLAAAIANGSLASLVVALFVTPMTTAGTAGWTPAAGIVTSVALWVVFLLVARPWHRVAPQPLPSPGTPAPDFASSRAAPATDPTSVRDPVDHSA